MTCIHRLAVLSLALLASGGICLGQEAKSAADAAAASLRTRNFQFEYGAKLTKLPPGKQVRVWLPVPPTNDYQRVREVARSLPAKATEGTELKYGNRMLYCEATAPDTGEIAVQMTWDIDRAEVRGLDRRQSSGPLSDADRQKFLAPDKRVPVGNEKVLSLIADRKLPSGGMELVRALYDRVDEHVKYDKSKDGYGFGDVLWVCDSRFGNCTDFHSLFNSLTRSKGIPSFFAIGFPLPENQKEGEIKGYHCWAFFHDASHGWVPVDISEANKAKAKNPELKDYYFGNLTADRVTFTVGRDLDLVPKQAGEPLNYFVFPHVEVDGKPHTAMDKRFYFKDR